MTGERYRQAAMTDQEIADITQRFAEVARILGIDELKIEHRDNTPAGLSFATMFGDYRTISVMTARIADRRLTCEIPVNVVDDAREGRFHSLSSVACKLVELLRAGHRDDADKPSRFAVIAQELEEEKK